MRATVALGTDKNWDWTSSLTIIKRHFEQQTAPTDPAAAGFSGCTNGIGFLRPQMATLPPKRVW